MNSPSRATPSEPESTTRRSHRTEALAVEAGTAIPRGNAKARQGIDTAWSNSNPSTQA